MQQELDRTKAADSQAFCWNGHECQRKMVQSISNSQGQLALLKHWLLIGVRSGSCGLLGNVLLLAHSCSIPLDEINVTIARPLPPVPAVQLPPFIQEWLDDANRLSCVRSQVQGAVSWHPNATFVHEVGDEASLRAQMRAAHGDISQDVDALICTAEMFLATPIHEEDRQALARLNGMLWSTLAPPGDPSLTGASARISEATAPVLVRCRLGYRGGSRPLGGEERGYTPCTLSGRAVMFDDSLIVHSVFSLVPETPAEAQPATLPVGLPQWPIDVLTAEMIAAAEAQAGTAAGYDVLEDLGLDLEPEDFQSLLDNEVLGEAQT